uniref:Uncharacterized protein n=1 Tax=Tanacetum cinerariifolium TaxID=118510 RepID=A0A699IBT7_TANCI|nr:hypothetical protein [Tanacetum cinerariifolium]
MMCLKTHSFLIIAILFHLFTLIDYQAWSCVYKFLAKNEDQLVMLELEKTRMNFQRVLGLQKKVIQERAHAEFAFTFSVC